MMQYLVVESEPLDPLEAQRRLHQLADLMAFDSCRWWHLNHRGDRHMRHSSMVYPIQEVEIIRERGISPSLDRPSECPLSSLHRTTTRDCVGSSLPLHEPVRLYSTPTASLTRHRPSAACYRRHWTPERAAVPLVHNTSPVVSGECWSRPHRARFCPITHQWVSWHQQSELPQLRYNPRLPPRPPVRYTTVTSDHEEELNSHPLPVVTNTSALKGCLRRTHNSPITRAASVRFSDVSTVSSRPRAASVEVGLPEHHISKSNWTSSSTTHYGDNSEGAFSLSTELSPLRWRIRKVLEKSRINYSD